MSSYLDDLLGVDVEVFSGADPDMSMGRGRVVGIAYEPTIVLEHPDGSRSHHVSTLPRVEYRPHRVGFPPAPVWTINRANGRIEETKP